MSKNCIVCDKEYDERLAALSRYAFSTTICSDCGRQEAFEKFFWSRRAIRLGLRIKKHHIQNVFEISDEQKANLIKLADYLANYPKKTKRKFHMSRYCIKNNSSKYWPYSLDPVQVDNECNTVACAAGHGPIIGIKPTGNEKFSWGEYVSGVFTGNRTAYQWMFDAAWAGRDNSPQGAAARIRYLLARGVPPNWDRFDTSAYRIANGRLRRLQLDYS